MPTLEWIGKDKIVSYHQKVPYRFLERKYSFDEGGSKKEDNGSGNMIIRGDNLEALKSLLPQYTASVKCIYIDPPYNTGNEKWIYNDNVNDPRMRKWLGEAVGKEGEDLSRHDKWLCMMYPRLRLLEKLMAPDGAIFISIDNNEKFNLKLICDEIFGPSGFVADIAVINNLKGRSDDKYIATAHESLLIYQKGSFVTRGVSLPEEYEKEYKLSDEKGRYRLLGLRKRGSNAREKDRPNLFYPIYYQEASGKLSLEPADGAVEILPKLSNGENGTWRWGKSTVLERISELEVRLVKKRMEYDIFQKDYLEREEKRRVKPKSFWSGSEFASETGTLEIKSILGKGQFDTPKPVGIVEYCLQQAADKDSIVLDSFAGSGTTAHAVLDMNRKDGGNRKFILVEMMDYAENVTAERVKRVISGGGKTEGLGGDFSFYEIGEPLFLDGGRLNSQIDEERLKEYIWYTEAGGFFEKTRGDENLPFYLGKNKGTAYYLYHTKEQDAVLDYNFLTNIRERAEHYVIYADRCSLSEAELSEYQITFKKVPRDIKRI
ncbi:site-specific DNA-methyltransferase [Qiania dongpingensis]|uniref:Site-specific DNA-methyltransferase n=1 Tax=Qiania dongpingensis TaxID=2763669 RepID=A0A7G9G648_9FIRM|nr:site-specific DNA-methyltransferase [Qiania dongpingensis]QNM06280.1 site-specific DNA-methyltransferase [Qiania dongpingensis]